jgi:hypothetical protein
LGVYRKPLPSIITEHEQNSCPIIVHVNMDNLAKRQNYPPIRPIWTSCPTAGDKYPHTGPVSGTSPLSAASSISAKSLPSPINPNLEHDPAMRSYDRSMFARLDFQGRPPLQQQQMPSHPPRLAPISQSSISGKARNGKLVLEALPPHVVMSPRQFSLAATQAKPRRQTIAAETRSMLLYGNLPHDIVSADKYSGRRQSFPNVYGSNTHQNSYAIQDKLRAWGHVFLGNAANADVFVQAVALYPNSAMKLSGEASPGLAESQRHTVDVDRASISSSYVTIRARVRPRALGRRPFLLQRNFNINELRRSVPDPAPHPCNQILQQRRISRPLATNAPPVQPTLDRPTVHLRRRSRILRLNTLPTRPESIWAANLDSRVLMRGSNAMPIRKFRVRVTGGGCPQLCGFEFVAVPSHEPLEL